MFILYSKPYCDYWFSHIIRLAHLSSLALSISAIDFLIEVTSHSYKSKQLTLFYFVLVLEEIMRNFREYTHAIKRKQSFHLCLHF